MHYKSLRDRLRWQRCICGLLLFLCCTPGRAGSPEPQAGSGFFSVSKQVEILEDKENRLRTLSSVLNEGNSARFEKNLRTIPNKGFSTSAWWLRFDFPNSCQNYRNTLLEIGFGNMKEIDLYVIEKQRDGKVKVLNHKTGGDWYRGRRSDIANPNYVFNLGKLPPAATIYLHVTTVFDQATFPLYLWDVDAYTSHNQLSGLLWGLYYGLLLAVLIYHLALWLFSRETGYLFLIAYLASFLLYELSRGYCLGIQYLWPNNKWLVFNSLSTFFLCVNISFLLFYSFAFDLKNTAPGHRLILLTLICVCVGGWVVTLIRPDGLSVNLVTMSIGVFTGLFQVFLGAVHFWKGSRPAFYYLLAALVVVLGGAIHSLNRSGALPYDGFLARYAMNIGSVLEFILLAIGLASTLRYKRRQADEEKRKAISEAESKGKEHERKRVAVKLHSEVGSSMVVLRQAFDNLHGTVVTPQIHEEMMLLIQNAYDDIRTISHDLSLQEFGNKGFAARIAELVDSLNRTGSQTSFYLLMSGDENLLSVEIQYNLFIICKELISNIVKHARATEVGIRFHTSRSPRLFHAEIRDNGVGADTNSLYASDGLGWRSILEKVLQMNGQLDTIRNSQGGITVKIGLPFAINAPE